MLCLRVVRGSRPGSLLRRLVLVAVSAGATFLLLGALGYALGGPVNAGSASLRLLWCLVPVAATVQLSIALARIEPYRGLTAGLVATGYSTSAVARIAAASVGLTCAVGSVIGLTVFLHLRGDLATSPLPPEGAEALGAGVALPIAGTLTLMALVPLLGAAATVLAMRRGQDHPPRHRSEGTPAPELPVTSGGIPVGLPWGSALICAGLVLELYAQRWQPSRPGDRVALPGGLPDLSSMMLLGWSLTAAGFVLAGPGLVHLCGQLLASARPGALRLLAGRGLQAEAARLGRPLGILCTVASAMVASVRMEGSISARPDFGPLTIMGGVLVAVCASASVLAAAEESRGARRPVTEALTRLGASTELLHRAALLRAGALLALLLPVTWLVAELAAMPMHL